MGAVQRQWRGEVAAGADVGDFGGEQKHGLAPDTLAAVLADSPAGSVFIDSHLPALLDVNYLPSFGIDRIVEELDTVTALAAGAASPSDMLALIADIHGHCAPTAKDWQANLLLLESA